MFIQFTKLCHSLCFIAAILSIAACETNPPLENKPQATESLHDALFKRARAAFLSNDYKTTAILLEPLAAKGNAKAQYTLGYLYYHGKGVKQDIQQARSWFIKSSDQNNLKAIRALTLLNATINNNETQKKITPKEKTSTLPLLDLRKTIKQPVVQPIAQKPIKKITVQPEPLQLSVEQKNILNSVQNEAANTTVQQRNNRLPSTNSLTVGNEWVIIQPARNFTIQLASGMKEKSIIRFVKNVELDGVHYIKSTKEGVTRYTVIHGNFDSFERANLKLARLKERGFKGAWIRKIRNLQILINNQ